MPKTTVLSKSKKTKSKVSKKESSDEDSEEDNLDNFANDILDEEDEFLEVVEKSQKEIIRLSKASNDRKEMLLKTLGNKQIDSDLLYELLTMVNLNEQQLKEMLKKESILDAIFISEDHRENTKTLFGENTTDTRNVKIGNRKYICPKCKSEDTNTETKQMKGGDEQTTDFNECYNCHNKWKVG